MILHTYRITYYSVTTQNVIINDTHGLHKEGPYAGMLWEDMKAFSAEDALTQFKVEHGGPDAVVWNLRIRCLEALPDAN